MKKSIIAIVMLVSLFTNGLMAQSKRTAASAGRAEYIEVEKGVKLHVTDLGEGQPIVLIHGWPLSDAMYEYQYQYLSRKGFRVIGITLRGFGKSDKPYGRYDFDVFSDDIKVVLDKLEIENATLGGFSMGGAVVIHYVTKYDSAHVGKLALFGAAAPSWKQREGLRYFRGGCKRIDNTNHDSKGGFDCWTWQCVRSQRGQYIQKCRKMVGEHQFGSIPICGHGIDQCFKRP